MEPTIYNSNLEITSNERKNIAVNLTEICPQFDIDFDLSKPPQNLDSFDDWNHRVYSKDSTKSWVIKTCNVNHCSYQMISMICQVMIDLAAKGISVPKLVTLKSDPSNYIYLNEKSKCISFVVEFVDNSILWPSDLSMPAGFLQYMGTQIAKMHTGTQDFYQNHPEYIDAATYTWEWSIGELPSEISKRLYSITDPEWRKSLEDLHSRVSTKLPLTEEKIQGLKLSDALKAKWFRKGLCHTDINDTNVLFSNIKDGEWKMSALLDFGDVCLDYIIYDIGSAGAYACMGQNIDHTETVAAIIAGYDSSMPREAVEVIYAAAMGRGLLSYLMSTERMISEPGSEYLAHNAKPGMEAAKKHLKYKTLSEAVDVIMGILVNHK